MTTGRPIMVDDMLKVASLGTSAVWLSPDARRVLYELRLTQVEDNTYTHDLWLVDVDGGGPRRLTRNDPTTDFWSSLVPQWAPDSQRIAYTDPATGQITLGDVDSGERRTLRASDETLSGDQHRPGGGISTFEFSPDGSRIAFLRLETPDIDDGPPPIVRQADRGMLPGFAAGAAGYNRGIEIDVTRGVGLTGGGPPPPTATVWVVDVATDLARPVTDPSLNVLNFCWSPDGRQLALGASRDARRWAHMATDIYVVDVEAGDARVLVEQAGRDDEPVWSPDGRWIAFGTQMGTEDWHQQTVPAVVPADGGGPVNLLADYLEEIDATSYFSRPFWSADSAFLYFSAPWRMSSQLFRVPVEGGKLDRVTPDPDTYYAGFTADAGGTMVAFSAESATQPADVYVARLDELRPRRLTDLNPQLAEVARSQFRRLAWRSSDDRWDVEGYVLLPPGYDGRHRLPLLVCVVGGPGMVPLVFQDSEHPAQVFAGRGYAVFFPNTRGRSGYGTSFRHAIQSERSMGTGPFSDVMSGVDVLVEQGIADPDRIGIFGHSYGGYLSAYTITQTDRFLAASCHEGPADVFVAMLQCAGDPGAQKLQETLGGYSDPYDPNDFARLQRDSTIFNMHSVRTPLLIEMGELSFAHDHGAFFGHAFARHGIPHELIVYPRTGHVTTEPLLRKDLAERNLAWFDYWLLDKPYPDAAKQQRYDAWKTERRLRPAVVA